MGDEPEMIPSRRELQWAGICLPPEAGSSALANSPRKTSYGVMPATSTTPRSR